MFKNRDKVNTNKLIKSKNTIKHKKKALLNQTGQVSADFIGSKRVNDSLLQNDRLYKLKKSKHIISFIPTQIHKNATNPSNSRCNPFRCLSKGEEKIKRVKIQF